VTVGKSLIFGQYLMHLTKQKIMKRTINSAIVCNYAHEVYEFIKFEYNNES